MDRRLRKFDVSRRTLEDYGLPDNTDAVEQILSMGYGLSFWPIPVMSAIETQVATKLGNAERAIWFIPAWTLSITVCFMLV